MRHIAVMSSFKSILQKAAHHHGTQKAVLERATNSHFNANLAEMPDDRILSQMTQRVFNAGFVWKVIEAKWPGFEVAFDGFDPHKLVFFQDEMIDRLINDERIVRNGKKIRATFINAAYVIEASKASGSFGTYLANWPADDQFGLMTEMNKRGSHLGPLTAQYFLRFIGWDAWISSQDVMAALVREEVLEKPAVSKKALKALQEAFNDWHAESGLPRAVISRVLAMSVG